MSRVNNQHAASLRFHLAQQEETKIIEVPSNGEIHLAAQVMIALSLGFKVPHEVHSRALQTIQVLAGENSCPLTA